jgi:hypothetical protein
MNFIKSQRGKVILFFLFGLVLAVVMNREAILESLNHPEKELLGIWDEVDWQYDKVDKLQGSTSVLKEKLRFDIKNQISNDLIIHEAEQWHFKNNGNLILKNKDGNEEVVEWRLKGRGHILKIKHISGLVEYYQIHQLDKNTLLLHFENDNHARGLVKITFKKRYK